jgi:hypothetical protein
VEKVQNEKVHSSYFSHFRVIKSRKMRQAGEIRNAYKILADKPERKRKLWRWG